MNSVPVSLGVAGPLGRQWLAAAESQEVADGPAGVRLLGRDLVLWRSPDGTIVAAPYLCPHSKGDLTKGEVKDGLLACPKHGWTFGDQGRCVFKPSGLSINEKAHLKTHPTAERYGLTWVWLAPEEPENSAIEVAADGDKSFRRIHSSVSMWRSNPIQIISMLLAQTDSPFDDVTVGVPFSIQGTIKSPDGAEHRRLLSCAPVDSRNSVVTSVVWTNSGSPGDDPTIVAEATADLNAVRTAVESETVLLPAVEIAPGDQPMVADWKHRLLAFFGQTASSA